MSETAAPALRASGRTGPRIAAGAMIADALLVLLFAGIGRASHDEGGALLGTLSTAWPFLAGLAVGWLALIASARTSRRPLRPAAPAPSGVVVWIAAVVGGMLLRAAVGEGTAFAFVLVATGFNLLTLVGWRLLAALAARRTRAAAAPHRG